MKHRSLYVTPLVAIALTFVVASGRANDLRGENLIQSLPSGFNIATRGTAAGGVELTEMIPNGETVDNWTKMVTTQVFFGVKDLSFQTYMSDMEKHWKDSCDETDSKLLRDGKENGYPFHLWMQTCSYNDSKKHPKITWFKFIQGNDSTYVAQYAFHVEPSKDQVIDTMHYLAETQACDTRRTESPCPEIDVKK
ncbi:hypothetical protein EKH79_01670 [Dyella dinghuensis]|uniref:Uncharacterized protein n=1 Tax=Dyella dinghuensis TaxID=1920169 RepID=A0A432LWS1_9GAMM|nr:hypothetical protein [Dyella dinghuensis]RUL66560.1 hypothetical protein EKH79_01670 [Dyella dinghuensis]